MKGSNISNIYCKSVCPFYYAVYCCEGKYRILQGLFPDKEKALTYVNRYPLVDVDFEIETIKVRFD